MPNPKRPRAKCLACLKEAKELGGKYCSNACQIEYQHQSYIQRWKNGKESGLMCLGLVSRHLKRYLRKKFKNKCCLCGWSRINPKTNQVPLIADHIDGNWRNNIESNLRLVCSNCDSLSPTYAGLNRGNSERARVLSKRAKERRSLEA